MSVAFDGNFDGLPRESPFNGMCIADDYPFRGVFVPPQYIARTDGEKLYIAVVSPSVHGGTRVRGRVQRERLCVVLLPDGQPDQFSASRHRRDAVYPASFFWFREDVTLKSAPACRRGDGQESLRVNAYDVDGERCFLTVHNVLGLTFRCPAEMWSQRFTDCEVDHTNVNHGDNAVTNLLRWPRTGSGGHMARSGALGGQAVKRMRF